MEITPTPIKILNLKKQNLNFPERTLNDKENSERNVVFFIKPLHSYKPQNNLLIEADLGVTESELKKAFETIEKNI